MDSDDKNSDLDLMMEEVDGGLDESNYDDSDVEGLEEILGRVDETHGLRVVPSDDTPPVTVVTDRTSNHAIHAIVTTNYPKHVKTEEEVQLFLELYQKHSRHGRLNIFAITEEWNVSLLQKLEQTSNANEVLRQYRFKTPQQMKDFKDTLEKKLAARNALHQYDGIIKQLQQSLASATSVPVPRDSIACISGVSASEVVSTATESILTNDSGDASFPTELNGESSTSNIVTAPTETSNVFDEIVPNAATSTEPELDGEFVAWVLNPSVQLCAACKKPRKIGDHFTEQHNGHFCQEYQRRPTGQEKKDLRAKKRKIHRRNT